jgi:hypothetical protein
MSNSGEFLAAYMIVAIAVGVFFGGLTALFARRGQTGLFFLLGFFLGPLALVVVVTLAIVGGQQEAPTPTAAPLSAYERLIRDRTRDFFQEQKYGGASIETLLFLKKEIPFVRQEALREVCKASPGDRDHVWEAAVSDALEGLLLQVEAKPEKVA